MSGREMAIIWPPPERSKREKLLVQQIGGRKQDRPVLAAITLAPREQKMGRN